MTSQQVCDRIPGARLGEVAGGTWADGEPWKEDRGTSLLDPNIELGCSWRSSDSGDMADAFVSVELIIDTRTWMYVGRPLPQAPWDGYPGIADAVPGVGDRAYWVFGQDLVFNKGNHWYRVYVGGGRLDAPSKRKSASIAVAKLL
jgi:hypothetical protein